MTRAIVFGLATLALGFMVRGALLDQAAAQEVTARDADGKRPATLHEINAVLKDLRALGEELQLAQTWVAASGEPEETRQNGGVADWRTDECRYQSLNDPLWTATEEQLTTECAVDKWNDVSLGEVLSIGNCESGYNRFAYNGDSDGKAERGEYAGIFQHAAVSWPGRVDQYAPAAWDHPLKDNWKNSRTMIVVSVRMMNAVGLSPWSCA